MIYIVAELCKGLLGVALIVVATAMVALLLQSL